MNEKRKLVEGLLVRNQAEIDQWKMLLRDYVITMPDAEREAMECAVHACPGSTGEFARFGLKIALTAAGEAMMNRAIEKEEENKK